MKKLSRHLALLVGIVVSVIGIRASAASWISPSLPEPGGNIAPALNTTSAQQTKAGGLTIQSLVTIENPSLLNPSLLTIGATGGNSRFCWNGECKSNWSEVGAAAGILHLLPQPGISGDTGYAKLVQDGQGANTVQSTVTGRAGDPTAAIPTYGVYGKGSSSAAGSSVGVVGSARNYTQHYGVYVTANNFPLAWAGYFSGDVAVSTGGGLAAYDLVIGGGGANNNDPQVAEICLKGVCRSSWPVASGSLWSVNGSFLRPVNITRSGAAAGSSPGAPLYVNVVGDPPTSANLSVVGDAKFEQYVVSDPPVGAPINLTCGDGICSPGLENNNFCGPRPCANPPPGPPYYCPEDCDPNPQVQNVTEDLVVINCPLPCPPQPPLLHVHWQYAPDPEIAGARVIVRSDRFPNGPNDTSNTVNPFIPGGDVAYPYWYYDAECNTNHTYYVGVYAYDLAGNFASGAYWQAPCITQSVDHTG